jgi:hypothetical protein
MKSLLWEAGGRAAENNGQSSSNTANPRSNKGISPTARQGVFNIIVQ